MILLPNILVQEILFLCFSWEGMMAIYIVAEIVKAPCCYSNRDKLMLYQDFDT